jgi:hypothetical protein
MSHIDLQRSVAGATEQCQSYNERVHEQRRWPLSLATFPVWPIIWLLLAATAARLRLGYWPSYNRPDPQSISPLILDVPVWPLLLFSPVAVVTSLLLTLRWWYVGRSDWKLHGLVTIDSFAIRIVWLWVDPAGLFEWWID